MTYFNIPSILSFILILTVYSCQNKSEHSDANTPEAIHNGEVHLKPEQVQAIGIELGKITPRNLKTSLKVNGKLTLPPQNQASVCLSVGGIIKSIAVTEGGYVHQGQVLATIQSTEFIQLQQDYLQSKHQLEFLKSEFDRQKELMKENINSVKAFEKAQAEYKTEWGKKQALAEKLKLYHTDAAKISADNIRSTFSVHAPITGFIHTISVNIGSFAEPNKQLFELVDNRFLHIDLTIFEKDISKVREGQKITFTDANDASHLHNATIFSINKAFESGQQAVIAHASIDSISETLLPGMFIEARIKIDDSYVDALPSEAIVSNGNDHYIFIEEHPATYRQVAVKTGTTDLNYTEIKPMETVDPNKKIVVKGAYYLLSELTKGEGEHEQ